MAKNTIHFEIGKISDGTDRFSEGETYTVYSDDSLIRCIKEWRKNKYTVGEYFIDVWEENGDSTPIPIANIDLLTVGV